MLHQSKFVNCDISFAKCGTGLRTACNVNKMRNVISAQADLATKSMHTFRTTLLALSLATAPTFAADGWIDLFNGKDLSGWTQKGGKASYKVEGDTIVGRTVLQTPNSFLCTEKEYDNFILELEFKVDPRLNSGVQFRSEAFDAEKTVELGAKTFRIPAGRVHGYQCEIDPDPVRKRAWTAGIYDESRRAWLYPGSLGGMSNDFSAQGLQLFRTNDWNSLRIVANGPSIRTYLNNVLRSEIQDHVTPKGFIGLQVHSVANRPENEGLEVRFRNVRLKELNGNEARVEAALNTLSDKEKAEGWRLLWDGKTTEGWRGAKLEGFPSKGWEIKNGVLTVLESGGGESITGGDIITRERFSEFELALDFKITPGANSGIKYFCQPNLDPITGAGAKTTTGSAIGLEYQILDDERHPDAKGGRDGNRTIASLYDLKTASSSKQPNAIGEWNTARVVVKGSHVEHWLNGAKVLEYDRGTTEFRELVAQSKYKNIPGFGEWKDGHILLQDHGNRVSFRNIKIRTAN